MERSRAFGEFKSYHPAVNFIYFTAVLVLAMLLMHPVCLAISLFSGILYSVMLNGKKALGFLFAFLLPVMVLMALINPLFNHAGVTVLHYLPDGNPLTLEAVLYGLAAAGMLACVLCWFSCYNSVMTGDKFIYLFGRVIPSLSLILSMCLRFVPQFKLQLRVIADTQKSIGRDPFCGSLLHRMRCVLSVLSVMVTWALENAVITADSMKSRGYGLPGRSAFSVYTVTRRDTAALLWLFFFIAYIILMQAAGGGLDFQYFPSLSAVSYSAGSVSLYGAYLLLCMTPVIIEVKEAVLWK